MTKETQSFKGMIQKLEQIVRRLDNETVSLEESLDLYQHGMKLSAACDTTLKNVKKGVDDLIKEKAEDVKNNESTDE